MWRSINHMTFKLSMQLITDTKAHLWTETSYDPAPNTYTCYHMTITWQCDNIRQWGLTSCFKFRAHTYVSPSSDFWISWSTAARKNKAWLTGRLTLHVRRGAAEGWWVKSCWWGRVWWQREQEADIPVRRGSTLCFYSWSFKAQLELSEVWLDEVLIHSQCVNCSRWQLATVAMDMYHTNPFQITW